ncbi:MAG TPA: hypothetical protein EYN06_00655, partial [Myxococcales bacterium]|nr:hypothetical protein [Myxococcales bacterium]
MTTFVGFVGMSFVPTPAFRQLGAVLGFGVGMALLLAVTLVPIAFSIMREPKEWRMGPTSRVQRVLDSVLDHSRRLSTGRPWLVIAVFSVVTGVAVYGTSQMYIDAEFTSRFGPDSQVRKDADFFNKKFARANFVQVFVDAPEGEDWLDPGRFERLVAFQNAINEDKDVERTHSLVNLIQRIHDALNPELKGELPQSRKTLAEYLMLFEMQGGKGLDHLLDFDRRSVVLNVQIKHEGVRVAAAVGDRLAERSVEILEEHARADITGILSLLGHWLDEIIYGQGRGLLFTFVIVAIMMCIGLRSIRVGLWSMLPNMLPLLVLGGYMGLAHDFVDSDALMLAMLAIGIGVDDTIHFLMRYRIESARTSDRAEALRRTYFFAGRAIIITTVTLALGFAPFAMGDYYSVRMFGTLLPMTLVVALLADLLLVPALVQVGAMAFHQEKT